MTRMTPFASPLLLGFDAMEKTLERLAKANEGYPPYNIERIRSNSSDGNEKLRITLAVAGWCRYLQGTDLVVQADTTGLANLNAIENGSGGAV